jgi:hypothetical protein
MLDDGRLRDDVEVIGKLCTEGRDTACRLRMKAKRKRRYLELKEVVSLLAVSRMGEGKRLTAAGEAKDSKALVFPGQD